jgi:hypothetical protein
VAYRHLTLREALASDRLADFVRQSEARGVELASGSELERALALLVTQRRSEAQSRSRPPSAYDPKRTPQTTRS